MRRIGRGELAGEQLAAVHRAYEKGLAASSALDFDDLLLRSVRLLRERPDVLELLRRSIVHLLVDEYQDTNGIQADLVRRLAGERENVFAVGDEDQSIYRWRGADVGNILDFSQVFASAKTVRLERNYRSTAPILAAAGAVVAENRRRLGKTLRAEKKGGDKVRLLSVDEERDEAREVVSRIAAASATVEMRLDALNPQVEGGGRERNRGNGGVGGRGACGSIARACARPAAPVTAGVTAARSSAPCPPTPPGFGS